MGKTSLVLSAVFLDLMAFVHLAVLVFGIEVKIGNWSVPNAVHICLAVVAVVLAALLFMGARRPTATVDSR